MQQLKPDSQLIDDADCWEQACEQYNGKDEAKLNDGRPFDCHEFEKQVEKNRQNLKLMQTNVKDVVTQNLLSILERIDADRDNEIEAHEVEEALEQLKKLDGVKVDAVKFRKKFRGMPSTSLYQVLENIVRDDVPADERIFSFPEQ